MSNRLVPEASELYPFYIVFKCEDGHFDWAFYPTRTRQEAVNQFLLSGATHEGVHLAAKEGYRNPYEYVDEDGIDVIIYHSEEEISTLCQKLTEKDKKLDENLKGKKMKNKRTLQRLVILILTIVIEAFCGFRFSLHQTNGEVALCFLYIIAICAILFIAFSAVMFTFMIDEF